MVVVVDVLEMPMTAATNNDGVVEAPRNIDNALARRPELAGLVSAREAMA